MTRVSIMKICAFTISADILFCCDASPLYCFTIISSKVISLSLLFIFSLFVRFRLVCNISSHIF